MSKTPMTDAVLGSAIDYPNGSEDIGFKRALINHARRMERHRAELIEALKACVGDIGSIDADPACSSAFVLGERVLKKMGEND